MLVENLPEYDVIIATVTYTLAVLAATYLAIVISCMEVRKKKRKKKKIRRRLILSFCAGDADFVPPSIGNSSGKK